MDIIPNDKNLPINEEENVCPVCLEKINDKPENDVINKINEILTECNNCHNFIHKICEKLCDRKCPICRANHEEWETNKKYIFDWDEPENLIFPQHSPIPQFGNNINFHVSTTGEFNVSPDINLNMSNTTSGFIENNYTTLAQQNIGVTYNTDISDGVTSPNYLTTTDPLNDYFLRQTRNNTWFNMVPIMDNATNAVIRPNRSLLFLETSRVSPSETSRETIEKKDRKKQMKKLEKKSQKMERRNRGKRR